MGSSYVRIDLENTQPENLEILVGKPYKVYVFLSESQKNVTSKFAVALQDLEGNGNNIERSGRGPHKPRKSKNA